MAIAAHKTGGVACLSKSIEVFSGLVNRRTDDAIGRQGRSAGYGKKEIDRSDRGQAEEERGVGLTDEPQAPCRVEPGQSCLFEAIACFALLQLISS